jgi:hypothetical protein
MAELADRLDPTDDPMSAPAALRDLHARPDPGRVVELLRSLGLTHGDIAVGVGATERTVRRWRADSGGAAERTRLVNKWRELDDLRHIVVMLDDDGTLTPQGIVYWLRARNRALDDRRPLEALGDGDFEAVRRAAQAFGDE